MEHNPDDVIVGGCGGVWHCTTPRERACPMCGESGPQMLGKYATATIDPLSLVTWLVTVQCSDPRVLPWQDYTAVTEKIWGGYRKACRVATDLLVQMEEWAALRLEENAEGGDDGPGRAG